MKRFIFTCGDPSGIGPEITLKTLNAVYNRADDFVFIIPQKIFNENLSLVKPKFNYRIYSSESFPEEKTDHLKIITIKGGRLSRGKPSKISGAISYNSLETASHLVKLNKQTAIITAPISKSAWQYNSIKYEGHTDYFGEQFDIKNPLMLFYSKKLIAALTTIHIPLKKVTASITSNKLSSIINSLLFSLKQDFQIENPNIAVLGLNPHAGENGRIGNEELNIIKPVIDKFGKAVNGPFVPDAFFGMKLFNKYDAVLGMYHDQILIPFKMMQFETGVNFTANLPIIRTSPDHGTAFDIAYKNLANPNSMIEAFKLAKKVLINRHTK